MPVPSALLRGLVDDAGLFPPTGLPMRQALERNAADRRVDHPMLTQRFLVATDRLDELLEVLPPGQPIELGLIHSGSAVELTAALLRGSGLIRHVELRGTRALAAVPADLPVYVEPDTFAGLPAAIDAVLGASARPGLTGVKVRCGGVSAELFPTVAELGGAIRAVVRARVPMKATAGLHSAVRNTDERTGFEHHGFLNLLTAVDAALVDGDVEARLAEREPALVAAIASSISATACIRVRQVLVSYGSCSTASPPQQAIGLGLTA